jgi:hypothetical protein
LHFAEASSRSLEDGKTQRWLAVQKKTLSEIIPRPMPPLNGNPAGSAGPEGEPMQIEEVESYLTQKLLGKMK